MAVGRSPAVRRLTVTLGIVSAGGRNGQRRLQTDAELNYGNVGGPLLDLKGRVAAVSGFVGHIHPQWGFNSGIGFGTTAAVVREVLPRLKSGEDVELEFPFLGVESSRDETGSRGAVVTKVLEGYPADRAGLLADDIIIEFAGEPLTSFNELRKLIARQKVGDVVTVKVRRGKAVLDLEVKLGKRPRLR
jgi:S1-C subfamily serine protease